MKLICLLDSGSPELVRTGDCSNLANHTPQPASYLEWQEWARQMSRTHRQIMCVRCGLWSIWIPKTPNRNKAHTPEGKSE